MKPAPDAGRQPGPGSPAAGSSRREPALLAQINSSQSSLNNLQGGNVVGWGGGMCVF